MVATMQEIKKAKEIGKFLRTARQDQGLSLTTLGHKAEIPIAQLLALESGNFYTFINNPEKMYERANAYAKALGVDLKTITSIRQLNPAVNSKTDAFIPYFLRKKE